MDCVLNLKQKKGIGNVDILPHLKAGEDVKAKGQFTFNKQLMEHISVKAGERIIIRKLPDSSLKIEAEKSQIDILSLAGSMIPTVHLTDNEIQNAISEGYAEVGMKGLK